MYIYIYIYILINMFTYNYIDNILIAKLAMNIMQLI